MRVGLALLDWDTLLDRGEIRVGTDSGCDHLKLFHVAHRLETEWKGQFSGRTHATKVRRLATRLFAARRHMMRSQVSAAREKQEESTVQALRLREEVARVNGVEAILRESGAVGGVDHEPNEPSQQ